MTMKTREAAEAIEQFGNDLAKLVSTLDLLGIDDFAIMARINAIPNQEHLAAIAENFSRLGRHLVSECVAAEVKHRDFNPLCG